VVAKHRQDLKVEKEEAAISGGTDWCFFKNIDWLLFNNLGLEGSCSRERGVVMTRSSSEDTGLCIASCPGLKIAGTHKREEFL